MHGLNDDNDAILKKLFQLEISWLEKAYTSPDLPSCGVALWKKMSVFAEEEVLDRASQMFELYKNSDKYIHNASAKTVLEWFESLPPDSEADCAWQDKHGVFHLLEYRDVKEQRERAKQVTKKYFTLGGFNMFML